MKKSEKTKLHLMQTAIELFKKMGFEKTTMRQIAKTAGMALGSTYYYFDTKEAIVLAYYQFTQKEYQQQAQSVLQSSKKLQQKIENLFLLQFSILEDQKSILHALVREALAPDSRLSPFGFQSRALRRIHIQIFYDTIESSSQHISHKEKQNLSFSLWLIQMALIWLWLQDKSLNQSKTNFLVTDISKLITGFIKLRKYKLFSMFAKKILRISDIVYSILDSDLQT